MSDKPNILIVDDEEIARRSYSRVLSGVRCDTQSVASGDEALRAMGSRPFDVVLLDLRMPGDDGITVLRALKERWPESEVVVITGFPSIETAKDAMRLGACDYLAKPVDPDQVIHATRGAVLRKRWALHVVPGAEQSCAASRHESDTRFRGLAC